MSQADFEEFSAAARKAIGQIKENSEYLAGLEMDDLRAETPIPTEADVKKARETAYAKLMKQLGELGLIYATGRGRSQSRAASVSSHTNRTTSARGTPM